MEDWIDKVVGRWASLRPELPMEAYQVTGRIARLATRLARRQDEVFGGVGLQRGEVGVLSALLVSGPPYRLSPTRLFKGLMLSSAGMTRRLDGLERRGLVIRIPDPDDRRGILVELTDQGRALVDAAVAAGSVSEAQLVSVLDPEEADTLSHLLRKLLLAAESPSGEDTPAAGRPSDPAR